MKKIYLIAVSFFIGAALQVNGSADVVEEIGFCGKSGLVTPKEDESDDCLLLRLAVAKQGNYSDKAIKKIDAILKNRKSYRKKRNFCLALTAAALCALAIVYSDESNAVVGATCDGIKNVFSRSMTSVKYVKREASVFANFLQKNGLQVSNSMFAFGVLGLVGGLIGKSKRFAQLGGGLMLSGVLGLGGRSLLKQVS